MVKCKAIRAKGIFVWTLNYILSLLRISVSLSNLRLNSVSYPYHSTFTNFDFDDEYACYIYIISRTYLCRI